jgi:hypothetical protein
MNIANNILKHNLKNVYFLAGTALAGKTTMAKILAEKYGFIRFNDNWHEDNFIEFKSICDKKYQPQTIERDKKHSGITDWDAYFNRSVDEILADEPDYGLNDEYTEFAIIELIKLSRNNKVIADISTPIKLLAEISDYSRIACMLTSPELVTTVNYGSRTDHKEYLEWFMSMNEPEKKIAKQDELFRIGVEETFEEVRKYNLFSIVRTEESTVENTLKMLEKHFGLQ